MDLLDTSNICPPRTAAWPPLHVFRWVVLCERACEEASGCSPPLRFPVSLFIFFGQIVIELVWALLASNRVVLLGHVWW